MKGGCNFIRFGQRWARYFFKVPAVLGTLLKVPVLGRLLEVKSTAVLLSVLFKKSSKKKVLLYILLNFN